MENTRLTLQDVAGPLMDFLTKLLSKEGEQWLSAFKKFLRKENPWVPTLPPSFTLDKTKDGWTLLEDVPFDGKQFTPDIVEFLKPGETSVSGGVVKQRAKELNAHLGQRHAEYLLDHQDLVPKEWRGKFLVFPGTVWLGSDGNRYVPYLSWDGVSWRLYFGWLGFGWNSRDRFVRLRK